MFSAKKFKSSKVKDEYIDYIEYCAESDGKLPLLIYIHGAGSRGNSLSLLQNVGPKYELENGRKLNCLFVMPQCNKDTWFELYETLLDFIDALRNDGRVDKSRVYICGSSMGGYTVWQLIMSRPEWFAAAVPVCGGGMYWNAATLKNLPVWAFHGKDDAVVLPEESRKMVDAVNKHGGNAKLTVYDGVGHNSWEKAFGSDDMWDWLFSCRKQTLHGDKTGV